MGNICRSPTAEGVLRAKLIEAGLDGVVELDSAGTHDYHVGRPPDARSQRHALRRGYDLSALRARQVVAGDFARFDLVLAMDHANLAALRRLHPEVDDARLRLLMSFARRHRVDEVPDPYYGGRGWLRARARLCRRRLRRTGGDAAAAARPATAGGLAHFRRPRAGPRNMMQRGRVT
ncbi:protein-tyrosine-phosphatase [Cupriavidus sp. H19C3]